MRENTGLCVRVCVRERGRSVRAGMSDAEKDERDERKRREK